MKLHRQDRIPDYARKRVFDKFYRGRIRGRRAPAWASTSPPSHSCAWQTAESRALRVVPKVIFIGELRDAETVEFVLHSAETGYPVLSTLHSTKASQTIEWILNFFSREYHDQFLVQLSYDLKAIVSQRLIRSESGKRVPALEVLINTAFVQELSRKGNLGQLKKVMESGKQEGLQTFDLQLKDLVGQGVVSEEKAMIYADSPGDLRLKLRGFV